MNSEREIIIAFLFKRSGKSKLSFSDLYLTLSMDLNWFTPEDAKAFVSHAVEQKLLLKKGELIKPNFDYDKIVVPVGFYPAKMVFEEKEVERYEEERNVVKAIVERIVEKTGLDAQSIAEKIKDIEKEKNITLEVAALLIGKEYDVILDDCFEEIENKIFRKETI
jgi:hypothetical protein